MIHSFKNTISYYPDGKYRWIYKFPMLKNPMILLTVWKIIGIGISFPLILVLLLDIIDRKNLNEVPSILEVFLLLYLLLYILAFIGYFLVSALYNWHYIVLFEMDEKGILHAQQSNKSKTPKTLNWIATDFLKVKSVTMYRKWNTIKVNAPLSKNQIYIEDKDFDFVWDYITTHCIHAKIKT